MPLGPKLAWPKVSTGTWPAFNRYLYVSFKQNSGERFRATVPSCFIFNEKHLVGRGPLPMHCFIQKQCFCLPQNKELIVHVECKYNIIDKMCIFAIEKVCVLG